MQEWTRRRWLHTAVTAPLGLLAMARRPVSASASQAIPPAEYGAGTLPRGIRSRVISGVNGIAMHVLEAGYDPPGRPGLLLVHGFPELGYSWRKVMLPLAEAGYHVMAPDQRGYGRSGGTDVDLRRRPGAILHPESRARHDGADLRTRPSLAGRSGGARLRVSGRRMVRTHAPRHLPLGRDDECTLRRHGAAAVQYRQRPASTGAAGARHGRGARGADAAAQALSDLLHDTRGESEHVARATGPARVPARLLPRQERGLAKEHAVPAGGEHSRGVREAAALLRDGQGPGDGRAGGRRHADGRADRRIAAGCRIASWRCTRRSTAGPDSRADCSPIGSGAWRGCPRSCSCLPGERSTCRRRSSRGRATGVCSSGPGSYEAMQKTACTKFVGAHLIDGAGHWVQQEQPERVAALVVEFLRQSRIPGA